MSHIRAYQVLCLFGGVLGLLHIYLTGSTILGGLIWNLILAVLPYLFATLAIRYTGWRHYGLALLWLLFFPNSLYIFTDFIHLGKVEELIHFEIIYISTMAIAGMVAGFASLDLLHTYWNQHIHKARAWLRVHILMLLGVFGVFLGRFQRFNSWDILHEPLTFAREVMMVLIYPNSLTRAGALDRVSEQALYGANVMNPYLFIGLYFIFFMILYVFLYHTRRVK